VGAAPLPLEPLEPVEPLLELPVEPLAPEEPDPELLEDAELELLELAVLELLEELAPLDVLEPGLVTAPSMQPVSEALRIANPSAARKRRAGMKGLPPPSVVARRAHVACAVRHAQRAD